MFESWDRLLLGLLTGLIFGLLLQKGRVAKFRTIAGQFLLKDFTVLKVMGTAVIVGGIGVQLLQQMGAVSLHIKPLLLAGVLVGALFFGTGMAILGYCPGTAVAACGEGRRDAVAGVLGMLFGCGVYVVGYPWLQQGIQAAGSYGAITWPSVTQTSPWLWYGLLVALALLIGISHYSTRRPPRRLRSDRLAAQSDEQHRGTAQPA